MKVGIITWCCYRNFGTFLQAYALQSFLRKNGYDVELLNDYQYSVKQPLSLKIKIAIKDYIKQFFFPKLFKSVKKDRESYILYESFKKKYLYIDYQVASLHDVDQRYDAFVCGSDQIWNPGGFKRNGNEYYFASFASKPKIAYAPSIGVKSIPSEYKERFSELISDFSFISVREKTAVNAMKDVIEKPIEVVVDPTLLIDRKDWFQLIDNNLNKQQDKYLFLYLLTFNQEYISAAYDYAQLHNLKVRIVKACGVNLHIDEAEPAGPLEFLNMIAGASYVMTDSFHAAIFSMIYNKAFVVFKRFKDNDVVSQNSRVENLLGKVGLKERLIDENHLEFIDALTDIDFGQVDHLIKREIQDSQQYLINALKIVQDERS